LTVKKIAARKKRKGKDDLTADATKASSK